MLICRNLSGARVNPLVLGKCAYVCRSRPTKMERSATSVIMPGVPSLIGYCEPPGPWFRLIEANVVRVLILVLAERRDQQPDYRLDHAAAIPDSLLVLDPTTIKNCQLYRS